MKDLSQFICRTEDDPWMDGSRFDSLEHARGHLRRNVSDYPKNVIEIYGKENHA